MDSISVSAAPNWARTDQQVQPALSQRTRRRARATFARSLHPFGLQQPSDDCLCQLSPYLMVHPQRPRTCDLHHARVGRQQRIPQRLHGAWNGARLRVYLPVHAHP